MQIVYLDQNKWIELARAEKHPERHPEVHALLETLHQGVSTGRIALPLTATNIYETQKIADPRQRHDLALVQSFLSRGLVFRGRHKRLEVEIAELMRAAYGGQTSQPPDWWFLSEIFFEAFFELSDPRQTFEISDRVVAAIRQRPQEALYDYLVSISESTRLASVRSFTEGSRQLRLRIEERRKAHAQEPLALRRRIYGAILMQDEIDLIFRLATRAGAPWQSVSDIGSALARRMIDDVPAFNIEREIALRLEAQSRHVVENDFRDMQSFCAVIPYADAIIAENMFVNLARQARLDRKYGCRLSTSVLSMQDLLACAGGG